MSSIDESPIELVLRVCSEHTIVSDEEGNAALAELAELRGRVEATDEVTCPACSGSGVGCSYCGGTGTLNGDQVKSAYASTQTTIKGLSDAAVAMSARIGLLGRALVDADEMHMVVHHAVAPVRGCSATDALRSAGICRCLVDGLSRVDETYRRSREAAYRTPPSGRMIPSVRPNPESSGSAEDRTWAAWLIEGKKIFEGVPTYLTIEDESVSWTTDPLKALHFVRKQDADSFAFGEDCWRVQEHLFVLRDGEEHLSVITKKFREKKTID